MHEEKLDAGAEPDGQIRHVVEEWLGGMVLVLQEPVQLPLEVVGIGFPAFEVFAAPDVAADDVLSSLMGPAPEEFAPELDRPEGMQAPGSVLETLNALRRT